MRFKGTWILLIIAVLIVAYFFLIEQPGHERKLFDDATGQKLTRLDRDAISLIRIESAGRPDIEFEKRDGIWKLTGPIADIADDAPINTLITSIADADIERKLEPDAAALAEFGLNETATHLTLMTAEGDTAFTLIVGSHTLTKSHFYARENTRSEVLILPATVRRYAVKELSEYRDKRVVDFLLEDVAKYRLTSDAGTFEWELQPESGWFTVLGGDTICGDRQEVEAIMRTLRGLRVRSFVSDDPAAFNRYWEKPEGTLSVWTMESPTPIILRCGLLEEGEFYAKRDDSNRIIKLDGVFLEAFGKTVADLREKRLLAFDRDRIASITVLSPDTSGTILKSGAGWGFPNPALGAIDKDTINALLAKLESLKFDSVIRERWERRDLHGFEDPLYRVALLDAGGTEIDEIIAGERGPASGTIYVTSTSSRLLAFIDEQKLLDILSDFERIASE
jgi:hypothetical protein